MTRATRYILPTVVVGLLALSVSAKADGWGFGFSFGWGHGGCYAPTYVYRPPVIAYAPPVYYPAPVAVAPYYYYRPYPYYYGYGWGPRAVAYRSPGYYRSNVYFGRSWYPGYHRAYSHHDYRPIYRGGHYRR